MPGAPKELAALSLEQLGQLGIVPSGNGTSMHLSGGACLPSRTQCSAAGLSSTSLQCRYVAPSRFKRSKEAEQL